MEINLVTEAFKFMLLGMGIVFSFLIIMIFALKTQTIIITKYFINKDNLSNQKKQSKKTQNLKTIAAITAVIQHHKNIKG